MTEAAPPGAPALLLHFTDHLSRNQLERALAELDLPSAGKCNLIINVSGMKSYDADARSHFITWHKENGAHIGAVAVVGAKPMWRLVIHTMALASGVTMKPVDSAGDAQTWFDSQP